MTRRTTLPYVCVIDGRSWNMSWSVSRCLKFLLKTEKLFNPNFYDSLNPFLPTLLSCFPLSFFMPRQHPHRR